uniref:PAS domain-containing protein n=1 Tax=Alexandrium andersonii TaxID=327968 RepID=A0A7S2J9Z7_9DINO|mmetsp:Transcript_96751/g.216773  ORF Transcript_96751/g.216773 Transcript_96751/m.216773 type:complete len:514 (+) Transcript_96751:48-1589(+)
MAESSSSRARSQAASAREPSSPASYKDPLGPLAEMSDGAVVLYAPSSRSIAGINAGFRALTGYNTSDVRFANRGALYSGVPEPAISRSAQKNFGDFCQTCLLPGVLDVAQSSAVHAFSRNDGSIFSGFETFGLCFARQQQYVVGVYIWLCEGPVCPRLPPGRIEELKEQARQVIGCLKQVLRRSEVPVGFPVRNKLEYMSRGPAFFGKRLQERCILFEGARSAARREPEELPIGCMLFGSMPMIPTEEGIRFSLRVDAVSSAFEGLPLLGFTRRRPTDEPGQYPAVARCLGRSVLVGASGEAFARDQEHHFKVGFKKIPESEVASWSIDPDVPVHMRRAPVRPRVGDILECRYTLEGRIQFWLNGAAVLDFDIGRPVEVGAVYWPVIDISHSVSAMTLEAIHCSSMTGYSLSEISTDDGNESSFEFEFCRDLEDTEHEGKDDWQESGVTDGDVTSSCIQDTGEKKVHGTVNRSTAASEDSNQPMPPSSMAYRGAQVAVGAALVAVVLALRSRR